MTIVRLHETKSATYNFFYSALEVFVEYFSCHLKDYFNVLTCFRRCFEKEWYFVTLLKVSCLLNANFAMLFSVFLIPNEDHYYIRFAQRANFFVPLLQVFERVPFR